MGLAWQIRTFEIKKRRWQLGRNRLKEPANPKGEREQRETRALEAEGVNWRETRKQRGGIESVASGSAKFGRSP